VKGGGRRLKRAPAYLVTGALAGFAGVLGLHGRAQAPAVPGQPKPPAGQLQKAAAGPRARASAGGGAPAAAGRRATGRVEPYGYGELAVRVTVHGQRITGLTVPLLRTAEPYSQQIAVQVIPTLKSEILAAGSAKINAVSGATYTSEAYAASVQSALDKLHLK
jgi:FMN-binding domain